MFFSWDDNKEAVHIKHTHSHGIHNRMVMSKDLVDKLTAWGLLESEQEWLYSKQVWIVEDFKKLSGDDVEDRHHLLKYFVEDMKKLS